jgi:hypothetical protein
VVIIVLIGVQYIIEPPMTFEISSSKDNRNLITVEKIEIEIEKSGAIEIHPCP